MAVFSDGSLFNAIVEHDLEIEPLNEKQIQPASIDLMLANDFKLYRKVELDGVRLAIDLGAVQLDHFIEEFDLADDQSWALEPQGFCLGRTREKIKLSNRVVGRVEGKSSLGRLGLVVHATAGFIDPGFEGTITLELFNLNPNPIIIRPGRSICQLSLMTLTSPALRGYGSDGLNSKYQGQYRTTESKYAG